MKPMRLICATLALTITLTLSTFAGEIHTPGTPQPPPPSQTLTQQGDTTGEGDEIQATGTGTESTGSVFEATLNLLGTVLSLL
jgi:hypothetical protein